jgi:hypothetical protein
MDRIGSMISLLETRSGAREPVIRALPCCSDAVLMLTYHLRPVYRSTMAVTLSVSVGLTGVWLIIRPSLTYLNCRWQWLADHDNYT